MMGPRSTAEYLDCRLDECETALADERERRHSAESMLSDLRDELRVMRETLDERIAELDAYLKQSPRCSG